MPDETFPNTRFDRHGWRQRTPDHSLRTAAAQKKTIGLKQVQQRQEALRLRGAEKSISYADAGVDITSAEKSKQRIKMLARKTFNRQVLWRSAVLAGCLRWIWRNFRTLCWCRRPMAWGRS